MANPINVGGILASLSVNSKDLEKGLADGRRAINAFKGEIRQLQKDLAANLISLADYNARMAAINQSMNDVGQAMNRAYGAVNQLNGGVGVINAGLTRASNSTAMFGMAMMQVGSIIDDVQYGFVGVVNNIGPLAYGLAAAAGAGTGMGMAIGAGAQIAAVATYQLYAHWTQLTDAMGVGVIRTEADRMEELGRKTKKTADETERFNKYKREQNEITALLGREDKEKSGYSSGVKDIIGESGDMKETGGNRIVKGIIDVIRAGGGGAQATDAEKEQMAGLEKVAGAGLAESKNRADELEALKKKVQERIDTADAERAKKLMLGATDNVDDLKALIAKVKRHPNAFPEELLSGLEAQLPENREKREQARLEAEGNKNVRKFEKEQEEKQLSEKQQQAHWEAEGNRNVRKFEKDREKKKKDEQDEAADFDEHARKVHADLTKKEIKDARENMPGVDEVAKTAIMQANATGDARGLNAAKRQIYEAMKAQGIDMMTADSAVNEIFGDAGKSIQKQVINEALNGRPDQEQQQQKTSHSEQFDAASLAQKVQAGVSNEPLNEQKKQTGLLENINKVLVARAQQNPVAFKIVN